MANSNLQDQLNDNKDVLEKKSGSLSATEKWKLESMRGSSDVVENAKKTILDIKAQDWTDIKVSAENLMKEIANWVALAEWTNYKIKLSNANIMIGGKKIDNSQFWRGSELMAFLQVAAWWNLVPDWKFGRETAAAFSMQSSKIEANKQNEPKLEFGKVGVNELTTHNFYSEFAWLFGIVDAKIYKDTFKAFSSKGELKCTNYNGQDVRVSYTSSYKSNPESISFKLVDVQKEDLNIDNEKLLKKVKSIIDDNEWKLKLESWKQSVVGWVENVKVTEFKSSLVSEYITNQWRRAVNWTIDFNPWMVWNGSGINIVWNQVSVNFPWKGVDWKNLVVNYKLSDMQTNNKFDDAKFVEAITKTIEPMAKTFKKDQLTNNYNYLSQAKIWSIPSVSINSYIKSYEGLKTTINDYTKLWIEIDKKIVDDISSKIEELTTQKNYLRAKAWLDGDVKSLETNNTKEMSRDQMKKLEQQIKSRVDQMTRWVIELPAPTLNIKDTYLKAKKWTEYDAYLKRYENLL